MKKEKKGNNPSIDYTHWFNDNFNLGLTQILKFSVNNPGMALVILTAIARFYLANKRRERWEKQGVKVPPMLIYSITSECNLDCAGCYAKLLHTARNGELNSEQLANVIQQADDIGISYILIAGGEPFMRNNLLNVTAKHPGIVFTPFTNGLLIENTHIEQLKKQKHVLPIISFEGYELETDKRRGLGVYENGLALIERLNREGIYFGVSITSTRENFDAITSQAFINKLAERNCRIFFFINFIPVADGFEHMKMTQQQVDELNRIMSVYRKQYQALFLAFPGSEIDFGGCLAAGKGFVHINSEGDVQPCPFSPYSDDNLKEMPLIEALKSPLLKKIRSNSDRLDESNGICALWNNREWVASLVKEKPFVL